MDKEAAAQYAEETTYCWRDAFIFLPAAETLRFFFLYVQLVSRCKSLFYRQHIALILYNSGACRLHDIWAIVEAQGAICKMLRLIPSVCQAQTLWVGGTEGVFINVAAC